MNISAPLPCLIIEDELPAARQLEKLLNQSSCDCQILGVLDSVEESVQWLRDHSAPHLIFMDIQLADGLSFQIFEQVDVEVPVIFTTAFDQYAIRAFQVNSVDYLLKPIQPDALDQALRKFQKYSGTRSNVDAQWMREMVLELQQKRFKERFLVKSGKSLSHLSVSEITAFFAEDGLVFLFDRRGKKYPVDYTLDQLDQSLDPHVFFRVSRKFIVSIDSIQRVHPYFNHRLALELQPAPNVEVIVSRERVAEFKKWMDQ